MALLNKGGEPPEFLECASLQFWGVLCCIGLERVTPRLECVSPTIFYSEIVCGCGPASMHVNRCGICTKIIISIDKAMHIQNYRALPDANTDHRL